MRNRGCGHNPGLNSERARLLDRVAGFFPGLQPSKQGRDVRIPQFQFVQIQRRTGAGILGRSSTVKDNVCLLGQLVEVICDLERRHRNRPHDVL